MKILVKTLVFQKEITDMTKIYTNQSSLNIQILLLILLININLKYAFAGVSMFKI